MLKKDWKIQLKLLRISLIKSDRNSTGAETNKDLLLDELAIIFI